MSIRAELGQMFLEMLNDVRGKVHETFFGQHEGNAMPGTAMNPTQYQVNADLQSFEAGLDATASLGRGDGEDRGLSR